MVTDIECAWAYRAIRSWIRVLSEQVPPSGHELEMSQSQCTDGGEAGIGLVGRVLANMPLLDPAAPAAAAGVAVQVGSVHQRASAEVASLKAVIFNGRWGTATEAESADVRS